MEFLKDIEQKWQRRWEEAKIFEANPDPQKKKFFLTVPYPYCSGSLHIGHGRTYTIGDIIARYMRMKGCNVLWPMAFHITGTPVLGISKRIELGEKDVIDLYKEYVGLYENFPDKVEEIVRSFKEPWNVAKYFANVITTDFKALGFSIDWRRSFTTGDKEYNSFIAWQFNKLKERGYTIKGKYPILFCLRDENAVGEDDILRGDEIKASVGEYVLIKFDLETSNLVAATMRPETIFGVTNIWINPKEDYVKAVIDGENWIVSNSSIKKLEKQGRKINVEDRFKGTELIGKHVKVPLLSKEVVILPANFVNVNEATGVVYSVPAHAPWDYVGLKDLQEHSNELKRYKISAKEMEEIKPIPMIQVKGYGEFPAVDECQRLGVKDINDAEKIDVATESLYKTEFYNGILKPICGEYQGLTVQQAKEKIFEDLKQQHKSDKMYEVMALEKPVECRCGGRVIVAVLPDQWFINYGNEKWKQLARECLASMKIHPNIYRKLFEDTIEWLHERPCARKRGIGTPLPWDKKWIVESLSDSTIYMSLYTIIHLIRTHSIRPEQLTDAFWDYVLLNNGNPEEVEKITGISKDLVEIMKKEFEYWYPNDQRHTAVGHITNHLTFFIFNHAGIFARKYWPRMISINEYVIREGAKMSKSKGNVMPLVDIPRKYSADFYRLYIASAADLQGVMDWREEEVKTVRGKLERMFEIIRRTRRMQVEINTEQLENCDRWFVSEVNRKIKDATEFVENLEIRKYIQKVFFEVLNDVNYYQGRAKPEHVDKILGYLSDKWIRLLSPVIPHICEELWEMIGEKGFVSLAAWPTPDEAKIDIRAEENEALIANTLEDTRNIIKATGMTPKKLCYYTAASWKWKTYLKAMEKSALAKVVQSELMRDLLKEPELKAKAEQVAKFVSQIVDEINKMSNERKKRQIQIGVVNESQALKDAASFFKRELNATISIYQEEDSERYDPKKKAQLARPYRPAIYME